MVVVAISTKTKRNDAILGGIRMQSIKKDYETMFAPSESNSALEFANALWSEITKNQLLSKQKNDICDYLLYLFNKHDSAHFLDSRTNAENELILRMPTTKIKTSKKNIFVKFMRENEQSEVFEMFLSDFVNGRIAIKDANAKGRIKLVIENPVYRNVLESKLKERVQENFEYSLNSESVEISCGAYHYAINGGRATKNKREFG